VRKRRRPKPPTRWTSPKGDPRTSNARFIYPNRFRYKTFFWRHFQPIEGDPRAFSRYIAQRFATLPVFRAAYRYGILPQDYNFDFLFTLIFLSCCGFYLYHAQRGVYRQGRLITLLKCLALAFSVAVIIQTYRFILFFTTFYSV
jgi:hypothetical protein